MAQDQKSGISLFDVVLVVVGGLFVVWLAFSLLGFVASVIWTGFKLIIVVAIILLLVRLVFRKR